MSDVDKYVLDSISHAVAAKLRAVQDILTEMRDFEPDDHDYKISPAEWADRIEAALRKETP